MLYRPGQITRMPSTGSTVTEHEDQIITNAAPLPFPRGEARLHG